MDAVIEKVMRLDERDILLNFLEQLEQNLYDLKINVKTFIEKEAPFHAQEALIEYLGNVVETRDAETLSQKIESLCTVLKALPIVTLTVAFDPTDELVLHLSKVAKEEFSTHVLWDFIKDITITGGAVVEGNGRIEDYTIKKYFEDRFRVKGTGQRV